ncbi:hypothetical protein MLD38_027159 [Melastoma candidum]|uniref:Uncharacterized protein n=1 Tax=Melastoma candidum TaxID=119954 RepID=A0ACB9P3P7_9MYRT|nr:hypothetical protein MLD38_027159 [Melastoma candidum]
MYEQNGDTDRFPKSLIGQRSPPTCGPEILADEVAVVDTSIEKLYENVYDMQSSGLSPSRHSFESDGEESGIDSELHHLVRGESREVESMEGEDEEEVEKQGNGGSRRDAALEKRSSLDGGKKPGKFKKIRSLSTMKESATASKLPLKSKSPSEKASLDKSRDGTTVKRMNPGKSSAK